MEESQKTRITVWIFATQGGRLAKLARQQREEKKATVKALIAEGKKSREARIIVAAMTWPALEELVADAVRLRLAEPDLAGPWRPLSRTEAAELSLSGRWPGASKGISLVERNYSLPSDLVESLRTASWRVSVKTLRELHRKGLVGSGVKLTEEQKRQRDELAERLHSPGRIVRQALARFGPTADTRDVS
ncbi:hypothetical protein ACFTZI_32475 [Streptomyces decoyicus]|uniref:hypothetical protein n=1 Tax=Streptomyces decoyicus TaxID=249567 RepID=UPI00362D26F1